VKRNTSIRDPAYAQDHYAPGIANIRDWTPPILALSCLPAPMAGALNAGDTFVQPLWLDWAGNLSTFPMVSVSTCHRENTKLSLSRYLWLAT
jgi:hypothetical protein